MASSWAAKRKLTFTSIIIVVAAIAIGIPLYFFFHKVPTCDDGVQNQDEKGIDCGGVCTRLCPSSIANPIVLWQRSFQVVPGVYNAVAYVQNPNVLTQAGSISYIFRLYDANNILIVEREGQTFIPANQTFAIFESGLQTGSRVPARTTFDFTQAPQWTQLSATTTAPLLSVQNVVLKNETTAPRLEADVVNSSLKMIGELEAVAILYDSTDTAIAASRTIVDNLSGGGSSHVVFTWPKRFSASVVRKEISVRIYPNSRLSGQ